MFNHYHNMETFQVVLMDTLLPSELLAHLTSFLSYKDTCSLLRVNSILHSKLSSERSTLPKSYLTTTSLTRLPDGSVKLSVARNSYNKPKKEWLCTFQTGSPSAKRSRCETLPLLTEFYDKKGLSGMKWDAANKYVEFSVDSIDDAINDHFNFILLRANMLFLKLKDLEDTDVAIIARNLLKCRSKCGHLMLNSNRVLGNEFISLIDASGAETINISLADRSLFSDVLFTSRRLRQVWSFTLSVGKAGDTAVPFTDDHLLFLSADTLELFFISAITADGIKRFLEEWATSGRKISSFIIGHAMKNVNWPTVLAKYLEGPTESSTFKLKRSDGSLLNFTATESEIRIFVDEQDEEGEDYDSDPDDVDNAIAEQPTEDEIDPPVEDEDNPPVEDDQGV